MSKTFKPFIPTTTFQTALAGIRAAKIALKNMERGESRSAIRSRIEHAAAAKLVLEAAELVNLFPLSRTDFEEAEDADSVEPVKLDHASVMEELEMMHEQCLSING